MMKRVIVFLLLQALASNTTGFVTRRQRTTSAQEVATRLRQASPVDDDEMASSSRREVLQGAARLLLTSSTLVQSPTQAGAEERGRCDAEDVRCQQDGQLGEAPVGRPIPRVTNKITHVVQLIIDVGERREEAGFIRFGLYGEDCPQSTREMLLFLSRGITSMDGSTLENSIGLEYAPVSLTESGSVPTIYSGKAVDFGVFSQAKAYAKSRGLRTAGPNFVPQNRPPPIDGESFPRPHEVAGLISIPTKGIGYGGPNGVPIDEAYASAFTITADATPSLDDKKSRQRVIGQVIDDPSMQFLARLASLPVQKGKGSGIPGAAAGPPLLKVRVREIGVQKVGDQSKDQKGKGKKGKKK